MTLIVSGIPGVICNVDDILFNGRIQKEHDQRVQMVLQKMEVGVTLNEKYQFSTIEATFLEHLTSKEGIRVDYMNR